MHPKYLPMLILLVWALNACAQLSPSAGVATAPASLVATANPSPPPATIGPTPSTTQLPSNRVETILSELVKPVQVQISTATAMAAPAFSWHLIDGAAQYVVVVAEPEPYNILWYWIGQKTGVGYGDSGIEDPDGLAELAAQARIPTSALPQRPTRLEPSKKYVWSIAAYGADGHVLAATVGQPLP